MNIKRAYLFIALCIVVQNQDVEAKSMIKEISSWFTNIKNWVVGTQEVSLIMEKKFNPRGTIIIENIEGSITVKGWDSEKVSVEAIKESSEAYNQQIVIDTHFSPDHAVIKTCFSAPKIKGLVHYKLLVPHHCCVRATTKGPIKIKRVHGAIHAQTSKYGSIEIRDAMQSVIAQTPDLLSVSFKCIPLNATINLESLYKDTLLYLPPSTNADLWAITKSGIITSDLYICLKPQTVLLNTQTWEHFKHEIRGTLGNGGASIKISSENGNIKLLEY